VQYFSGKLPKDNRLLYRTTCGNKCIIARCAAKLLTEKIKSSIQILLVMFKVQEALQTVSAHFYFDFALNFYLDMYTFDDFKTFKIL
jgi:hypothetical protein